MTFKVGSRVNYYYDIGIGEGTVLRFVDRKWPRSIVVRWDAWPKLSGLYAEWEIEPAAHQPVLPLGMEGDS